MSEEAQRRGPARAPLPAGRGGPRQDRRGAGRQPGGQRGGRARLRGAREGGPGAGGRDGRARHPVGRRHRARDPPAALGLAAARGDRGRGRPARRARSRRSSARLGDEPARRAAIEAAASTRSARDLAALRARWRPAEEPMPRAQERLTVTDVLSADARQGGSPTDLAARPARPARSLLDRVVRESVRLPEQVGHAEHAGRPPRRAGGELEERGRLHLHRRRRPRSTQRRCGPSRAVVEEVGRDHDRRAGAGRRRGARR